MNNQDEPKTEGRRKMTPEQRERAKFLAPIYRRLLEIAAEERRKREELGTEEEKKDDA